MDELFVEAKGKEHGFSPWTLRRWLLSEGLPHIRIGGRIFYRIGSIKSWLDQRENGSVSAIAEPEIGTIRAIK